METVVNMAAKKPEKKTEYVEPDPEFGEDEDGDGMTDIMQSNPAKEVFTDFTGGVDAGNSGRTDLTEDQAVLLTHARLLMEAYPGFGLESFPKWLEIYRMSVLRKSRTETVQMFQNKLQFTTPNDDELRPPHRF